MQTNYLLCAYAKKENVYPDRRYIITTVKHPKDAFQNFLKRCSSSPVFQLIWLV